MLREPVINDPKNPLVSILIHDYCGSCLRTCLESIVTQDVLENVEIIYIDNASADGAWEVALEFAGRYPGLMTLKRKFSANKRIDHFDHLCLNHPSLTTELHHDLRLLNGKYVVTLVRDDAFVPDYVTNAVAAMETDPLTTFAKVKARAATATISDWPTVTGQPLVNVLIHNYNYGRYLRQCLDSVFAQTYDNIRVIFSDNCSTDQSWEIATEFEQRHPGKMTIIRNRKNFGPATNLRNCYDCIEGKYFCVLCSDDAFMPTFVEECVAALENNPDAGFAMTHRAIIDADGNPMAEPPFYNQSCIIPGNEQAAVYMMAAVNPSISQIMYNYAKAVSHLPADSLVSRWYAQRLLDFELCCHYSMAYIKVPLLINRVHAASDSSSISANLLEAFGQYILPHQFAEMAARGDNMDKAAGRLPQALEKLGRLCLRYATNGLRAGDRTCALRYYHLAVAILPEIVTDPAFLCLERYWNADEAEQKEILATLTATENLTTRAVSYDPPPGWVPLEEEGGCDCAGERK